MLRCRDRWGREIVLPDYTWHNDILANHGELVGHLDAVDRTVRRPHRVTYDKDYSDREVSYRRGVLPAPYDRDYLKVVVEFRQSATVDLPRGRIVTAYTAERIKSGERSRWP